jgi:hypothetical protein
MTLPRLSATRIAALCVALALAVLATPASAQRSTQMVGGPLTTKRFERLLRAYVQPTTAEATALDRLHEAYLERFRAELDPELENLGKSMAGGMPTLQEFRKFMRELERLQARIGDADAALFASCAELIAEERRAGLSRVRDARERQRALGGLTGMSSMIFGGGGSFVDLADLATRDRVLGAVPADMRARFDAFLAAQEARLLVQARSYDKASTKALEGYFEATVAMQGGGSAGADGGADADGDGQTEDASGDAAAAAATARDEMQRRMQREMERQMELMRNAGAEPRKVVAANFAANRTALTELTGVLPQSVLDELRVEVANRAVGVMGLAMMDLGGFGSGNASPAVVAARMRRDGELDAESVAQSRAIVAAWRHEHAAAVEEAAEAVLENSGAGAGMMRRFAGGAGAPDEATTRLEEKLAKAQAAIEGADQKAFRALSALGGGRGLTYLVAFAGEDGAEKFQAKEWKPADAAAMADPTADPNNEQSMGRASAYRGFADGNPMPQAPSAREIMADLALVGVGADSADTIESVVAAWTDGVFATRIAPLSAQAVEVSRNLWVRDAETGYARKSENAAAYQQLTRRIADEYLAAEEVLFADLAAALGLAADGPELTALRLERAEALSAGNSPFEAGTRRVATPLRTVARAGLAPETARALFAESIDAWRALVASVAERTTARRNARGEIERLQDAAGAPGADGAAIAEKTSRAWAALTKLAKADGQAMRATLDEAAARLDEAAAAKLRLAARQLAYPELHRLADSASELLARALAAKGASDDQIARLEALKAEYDAVFESLTVRMIAERERASETDDAGWQEEMRRSEAIEKLRFQRDERTAKARSEARRILGDALASTVRGLVPDEDEALLADNTGEMFTPFARMGQDDE